MFWFLLFCDLLVPAVMVGAGRWMWKHPPKEINWALGYRTARSMKNQETWRFAHEHCGKTWWSWGLALLAISVVLHIPFYGASDDTLGMMSLALMCVQCAAMLIAIIPTERALKRCFTEDGERRET